MDGFGFYEYIRDTTKTVAVRSITQDFIALVYQKKNKALQFNNFVLGLAILHGFRNLAKARRLFNAQLAQALYLIISAKTFY